MNNTDDLAIILRRKAQLQQKKIAALKAFGLRYYRPSPKQDAFHRAGGQFKMRMVRAGNRFGKSTLGCAEDCAWMIGAREWYPESDPARYAGLPKHATKGLIITTDWDKVDEIWTSERGDGEGKLWKMLPSGYVRYKKKNSQGVINMIEGVNHSILRFETEISFKQNPKCVESSDWDFIHVDEPCPEKMYKGAARGLIDRGGSSWFTLTPLEQFWINDLFFPQDTGGRPRDNVWATNATIYENPFLSAEAIAMYESTLTDDEKACRLHGIPLHLSGLVYKEFKWDKHVLQSLPSDWTSWDRPPAGYTYYFAIDPHPQTPMAVLFCAVSPQGDHFYFTDIFERMTVSEMAEAIRGVFHRIGVMPTWGKMDPLGFIRDPITDTDMSTELSDNGVFVEKATKAREQGTLRVKDELKKPRGLYFTPACKRTLWEIQRYAWDEEKNKPLDENDHMMENLYRLELSDMRYIERAKDNQPIDDIVIPAPRFEMDTLNFAT